MKRYLLDLIENVRGAERGILPRIRRKYKMKKFQKYAVIGDPLDICQRANCSADVPGQIVIGKNCRVYGALLSQGAGKITIGDYCCLYERTIIGSVNSIKIGSCVIISNHVHIYDNNNHPTSPKRRREMCMAGFEGDAWRWTHAESAPIVIEDNVWIGEYAAILKGVTIGTGSIVASHAVVTKDVPPYTIVAGNPARVVKELVNDEI